MVDVRKLSFRKGVIGEDLERCPDCTWVGDVIEEYCTACEDSVDGLMRHVAQALEAIVRHCCSSEAGGLTPSDVPDLGMDQDGLDALMDELAALDA